MMMNTPRAQSVAEYIQWVQQALFEVDELRQCFEFDQEEGQALPAFLPPLAQSIQDLFTALRTGQYQFGGEELPFMALLPQFGLAIPFTPLLRRINATHHQGLALHP